MSKLVLNVKDEKYLGQLVEWAKKAGLAYQVIEDETLPPLPTTPSVTVSAEKKPTEKAKTDEIPTLTDDKKYTVGAFVTVYPTLKLVRHFEAQFTPEKVRVALKMSLKSAGATWDKDSRAYKFATSKALNEWVKAQKARDNK